MSEYLNQVGKIREQQISEAEEAARSQSSLGETLGLWTDNPADGETMEDYLLVFPRLESVLRWMSDQGLIGDSLRTDASTVVPLAVEIFEDVKADDPEGTFELFQDLVTPPNLVESTYRHPEVEAAILLRARMIAENHQLPVPANLGQAVIVWNVADLVYGGRGFSMEWLRQKLSDDSYLNSAIQPRMNLNN